jgi:hypothetical protein
MSGPVDRERIADLLKDCRRSYRSIGRELGISDWSVRRTARELGGSPRAIKRERREVPSDPFEGSEIPDWVGPAVILVITGFAIWLRLRSMPPPEM